MTATLYVIGCFLAAGQAPGGAAPARGDWILVPRLARGQELVYRGQYAEEAVDSHAQFARAYRLEARAFVLEAMPQGADVALLTVLRHRDPRPGVSSDPSVSSVRMERARVNLQGRLSADGVSLSVPLEGPPLLECGAFLEAPAGRIGPDQAWDVAEAGRPLQLWRSAGTEMIAGTLCLKLTGVQQSEDWDQSRADRTAWRRRDTVWLSTRLGIACRVERVIERRDPAHRDPTQIGRLRYDLDSSLQCPAPLAEDRRREILQAFAFRDQLTPLLGQPTRGAAQLANLVSKIDYHLENQPPTPYREVLLQLKRRAEAARRGETPPELPVDVTPRAAARAQPGELAPDFVATELSGEGSARPRRWLGRPVLFIFYSPASATATSVLRFGQRLANAYDNQVSVVGLSVVSDAALVRRQREQLGINFPILDGAGLRISYEVETTPKFVLLDATNIVRGAWLGWGQETPTEVVTELKRWLPPATQLPLPPRP
jgi:hypothetical protein